MANKSARLMSDVAKLISDTSNTFLVSDTSEEMDNLSVIIYGPEDTPFANGQYELKLIIPSNYPFKPPLAYFITPLWHPNVSIAGTICIDVLDSHEWASGTTLIMVVEALRALFALPNPDSPLNPEAASMLLQDPDMYEQTVRAWAHVHSGAPDTISEEWRTKMTTLQEVANCSVENALRRLSKNMWVLENSHRSLRH